MSILNVDKIQPIGSGSTVTVNATDTILTNAQAGVITATRFDGIISATTDDWITHQGDSNTRMGFPATDIFAVETAGSERLRITGIGSVGINNTSPATIVDIKSAKASDGLTITKGSNVAAFLGHNGTGDEGLLHLKDGGVVTTQIYGETGQVSFLNAGNVGIGTATADKSLTIGGTTPVLKLNDANGRILELRGGSTSHNPSLLTQYASLLYLGSNGTESVSIGQEHLTITNGDLIIGTSGHGIDFSAQTASSASGVTTNNETLDHFEEGTWTPTQATIGSWASGAEIDGKYQRVGNWVTASFIVKYASNGSGHAASIDGLPFTNNNTGSSYKQGGFVSYATNSNVSSLLIGNGENRIYIYTNTGSTYALTNMDNVEVRGTVIYRVA